MEVKVYKLWDNLHGFPYREENGNEPEFASTSDARLYVIADLEDDFDNYGLLQKIYDVDFSKLRPVRTETIK